MSLKHLPQYNPDFLTVSPFPIMQLEGERTQVPISHLVTQIPISERPFKLRPFSCSNMAAYSEATNLSY